MIAPGLWENRSPDPSDGLVGGRSDSPPADGRTSSRTFRSCRVTAAPAGFIGAHSCRLPWGTEEQSLAARRRNGAAHRRGGNGEAGVGRREKCDGTATVGRHGETAPTAVSPGRHRDGRSERRTVRVECNRTDLVRSHGSLGPPEEKVAAVDGADRSPPNG